jgi:chemotaxis protein CheD
VRGPERITLQPAGIYATREPTLISTVLGSCVSICLLGEGRGQGAMCHCLLPSALGAAGAAGEGRFVDQALEAMLGWLHRLRVAPSALRAKLFGGADFFRLEESGLSSYAVGRQNADMARRLLAERGIPLVADHTGGRRGRRIAFDTGSGEVRLERLPLMGAGRAA